MSQPGARKTTPASSRAFTSSRLSHKGPSGSARKSSSGTRSKSAEVNENNTYFYVLSMGYRVQFLLYDKHHNHVKVLQLISNRVSDEKSVFTAAALAAGGNQHGNSMAPGAGGNWPGGRRLPNSTSTSDLLSAGGMSVGSTSFGMNISSHSGIPTTAATTASITSTSGVKTINISGVHGGMAIPGASEPPIKPITTASGYGNGVGSGRSSARHISTNSGHASGNVTMSDTSIISKNAAYVTTVSLRDDRKRKPEMRYFENFSTILYEYHLWVPQISRFQRLQQQFWQFAPEYFWNKVDNILSGSSGGLASGGSEKIAGGGRYFKGKR